LGANRNHALKHATGSFVLFLDDDAMLGERFLEEVRACFIDDSDPRTYIITGIEELEDGKLIHPSEQSFLGFQQVRYLDVIGLSTVVINSAIFPIELFSQVLFDERLVYGCDEVDLTTRAVTKGFRIALCGTAINRHFRAGSNRDFYKPYTNASRIYVTAKRYLFTEKSMLKGFAFLILAPLHLLAGNVRRLGLYGIPESMRSISLSLTYLSSFVNEYRSAGADKS
jgi:GT2 family glycosyltransferase